MGRGMTRAREKGSSRCESLLPTLSSEPLMPLPRAVCKLLAPSSQSWREKIQHRDSTFTNQVSVYLSYWSIIAVHGDHIPHEELVHGHDTSSFFICFQSPRPLPSRSISSCSSLLQKLFLSISYYLYLLNERSHCSAPLRCPILKCKSTGSNMVPFNVTPVPGSINEVVIDIVLGTLCITCRTCTMSSTNIS